MSEDPNRWNPQQNAWSPDGSPYPTNPYAAAPSALPPLNEAWGTSPYGPGTGEQRSGTGVVAICLVGAALVVSFILSWISGRAIVDLSRITGVSLGSGGDFPDTAATDSANLRLGLTVLGQVIPTGLGIAGLVVGIVALKFRNARSLGITSIVLAVLAPFLTSGVLILAAAPAI